MTNTTTTAANVRSARDDQRAAEVRLNQLAEERQRVEARIQEASIEAAREKAQAARTGEEISSTAEAEVAVLRERLQHIPYGIHAQEIHVEETKLAVIAAEDEDRQARYNAAEAVFAEVKPRYEAVEKEYKAAQANRVDSTGGAHRTTLLQLAKGNLKRLEANPPGVDAPATSYSPRRSRDPRSRMTTI
jgi:hypothetical protein